ncbi:MAG TPA: amidase, partial [Terracidiphilus sp.]|nr:amidase [Terracidiphilus sp.]
MTTSRREFVALGSKSVLAGGLLAGELPAQTPASQSQIPSQNPTPGAPTAFGTAPAVGPEISAATLRDAERLVQVEMTNKDLEQAAGNWRMQIAPLYERRVGPRKVALGEADAPAT